MLPDDFAVLILTHRRPDKQYTVRTLAEYGYTGRTYLVLDDEDPTEPEYRKRYGDQVVTFDKRRAWEMTDDADNTGNRRGVVYARNMAWEIAESLGLRYFLVLDDDYTGLYLRRDKNLKYGVFPMRGRVDSTILAMIDFMREAPQVRCLCFSQGGDHIGGSISTGNKNGVGAKRKAMNGFLCAADRPFKFYGRINEDATCYHTLGRRGVVFLTLMQAQLNQAQTQANSGGLTEIYLDAGTYYKSFLTVMWEPSCVKVAAMGDPRTENKGYFRLHHMPTWRHAVPCIVPERYRKDD